VEPSGNFSRGSETPVALLVLVKACTAVGGKQFPTLSWAYSQQCTRMQCNKCTSRPPMYKKLRRNGIKDERYTGCTVYPSGWYSLGIFHAPVHLLTHPVIWHLLNAVQVDKVCNSTDGWEMQVCFVP
jgi:hypothetical protein